MRNLLRPLLKRRNSRSGGRSGPPNRPSAGAYRSTTYLPLRPWQIRTRTFSARRHGLDPVEVATFLDRVAGDLAAAYAEVARSREEAARIKAALRDWQSRQAPSMRDLARRP
ncbi:DivIVA domain-containing protein [Micromonospora siamensis]|uniref:DivIVA domain-containing protein n=1 Tax=Micromonospora siamensis TaxID=299152 RepID=A0A1C5GYC2_9ACTN|nr:DivIVA domain-containing protein [Micromonospora siamensis]SCG38703.1 DivIVA domain-containing protein [Micromonospora siamensis]